MKKIIVTPAGRKRFLSILSKYLIKYKSEFDEWHLWCNTDDKDDIEFMKSLENQYDFIKVIPLGNTWSSREGNGVIHLDGKIVYACSIPYFISVDAIDPDTIYLRLDDDIVFIKKGSIENLFKFRLENAEPFLVYGNIVNNAVLSHIHQKIGALPTTEGTVTLNALDQKGLWEGEIPKLCHYNFFNKLMEKQLDDYKFDPFVLKNYELVSIQVISWFGKDYAKFGGVIPTYPDGSPIHEENYQSIERPKEEGRPNVIFGDSLFCHFSAEVHRKFIEPTDILEQYQRIADEYL
jgi:hypothetical protein